MDKKDAPKLTSEIIAHPLVRLITVRMLVIAATMLSSTANQFTGSDRVARLIATEAAKSLKPCIFELGGKCPAIVSDASRLRPSVVVLI